MTTPLLATAVLAALTSATFPQPGTYRYTAAMGGQKIGAWAVTVTRDAATTRIDEDSHASVMGMQLSAKATLGLGPDLAPTSYDGSYATPGQNLTVTVTLSSTSATVSGVLTGAPQQVTLGANTRHFVVIEPGLLAGLFALPAQLGAWGDPAVTWITPTSAQAQSLETSGVTAPARPANVSPQDAVLSIDRPIVVTIWYDPATLVPDMILVPSQDAVLTRERS